MDALASLYRTLHSPPTIVLGFYARKSTSGPYFNHAKIVASDAGFAVVGGHNLYDSDYYQYPPVHDVSVEVHGPAAIDAQNFAAYLWEYGGIAAPSVGASSKRGTVLDVLTLGVRPISKKLYKEAWTTIDAWQLSSSGWKRISQSEYEGLFSGQSVWNNGLWNNEFAFQPDAKKASILTVGRMGGWGHTLPGDQNASDYMKGYLFASAVDYIRISHQDLVAMDVGYGVQMQRVEHATCKDLAAALSRNKQLRVQAVVSAPWGAGKMDAYTNVANGPQTAANYIMYYARKWGQGMMQSVSVPTSEYRVDLAPIWKRLQVAPFQFTNKLPNGTHFWPDGEREVEGCEGGITPQNYPKSVGNHCKVMIVDDTMVVGSDNHYPHPLAEINLVIEGAFVEEFKKAYWDKLWKYSMPSAIRQWSYDSLLSNE
jgi:murine toxin